MLQSELMSAGVQLMFLGMGIVFAFLAILIVSLKLMSLLVGRLPGTEEVATAQPAVKVDGSKQGTELVAVITAAVARFRSNKK